jgi:hypothetical protein
MKVNLVIQDGGIDLDAKRVFLDPKSPLPDRSHGHDQVSWVREDYSLLGGLQLEGTIGAEELSARFEPDDAESADFGVADGAAMSAHEG